MMTTNSRKVNQTEGKEVALEGSNMVALEGKMMALRCSMVAIEGKKKWNWKRFCKGSFYVQNNIAWYFP